MSLSLPKEYSIPRLAEFVWVEDFFVEEILGGAELTSDAIIRGCNPQRIKHLHSQSLTETLVKTNQHKTWIFGNQTQVPLYLLDMFMILLFKISFHNRNDLLYEFFRCGIVESIH